jgi:amino acid transporter
MTNLLTANYWFSLNPEPWLGGVFKILVVVFCLLVIMGMISGLFVGKNKEDNLKRKFWDKIRTWGLLIGFLGLFLIFSRQQRIGFLGMPFLFLLLIIWAVIWAGRIVRYVVKVMPVRREEKQKKEEMKKYL